MTMAKAKRGNKKWGAALRALIETNALTHATFADKAGMSKSAVWHIVAGLSNVSPQLYKRMCSVLPTLSGVADAPIGRSRVGGRIAAKPTKATVKANRITKEPPVSRPFKGKKAATAQHPNNAAILEIVGALRGLQENKKAYLYTKSLVTVSLANHMSLADVGQLFAVDAS